MNQAAEDRRQTAPIIFYFDFVSPFAYLGSIAIERLAAKLGRDVHWRPVLIGVTILKIMGMKPLRDVPLKGPYLKRDLERLSAWFGVDVPRHGLGSVSSVNACEAFLDISQRDPEQGKAFARAVFDRLWRGGVDITSADAIEQIARDQGLDLRALGSPASRARLRGAVDAAVAAGVFGVPSFVADGELFFGNDHLWMLEHWLTNHSFFREN